MPKSDPKPSVRTTAFRSIVEHRSHGVATWLQTLPAALPMICALVLVVVGVLARGIVGAICFGIITLFLGWLLFLSWPRLTGLERLMRGSVLLLTAVVTVVLLAPN